MRSYLLTGSFWAGTAERSLKTAAQTVIAALAMGQVSNAFNIDYRTAAGVALFASLLSLLTSVASAPIGPAGPSMVNDRPNPNVPGDSEQVPVDRSTTTFTPGRAEVNGGEHRAEP